MIKARFSRLDGGFSLKVTGHAGYSDSGDDIVCAAVSGIVYALAGYIAGECGESGKSSLGLGDARLSCGSDGEAAMRMAYIGLLQLALTYPECVCVDCNAWRVNIGKTRDVVA